MNASKTAFVLIGYQEDYFGENGILKAVIEESANTTQVLKNTHLLLEQLRSKPALIIQTPIIFSDDYSELEQPVGLLRAIKDAGAFRRGSDGSNPIDMMTDFGERILTIEGKDGFNAFANTELAQTLQDHDIEHVVLAGAVTSICIDSTGRSAHEQGYQVTVLSDCTCGRTNFEQDFYCEQILPLYAEVCSTQDILERLN